MSIPFNKPEISGNEFSYISDAIARGHLSGDGYYSHKCHETIEAYTHSPKALLTHSCTAALEMAAILLNLGPGDEVIMPSFTFVSTANAVVLRGATPVFVDVDSQSLNIDPRKIEEAINSKTKAIFVVHYAGVICDMEAISKIAQANNLFVVEDAAQALLSERNKKRAGSFGDMACFSFHETKNIISGEGGALTINNESFFDRAEIIREKGTNRKQFFKGLVDKYTWVDLGSSFLPSELTAAFLLAQLENATEINNNRMIAWEKYHLALEDAEKSGKLRRPISREHNAHMYYVIMDNMEQRDNFIAEMRARNITTPFHYQPLHLSPAGKKFGKTFAKELPITNMLAENLVRLPMYPSVLDDQDRIIIGLAEVLEVLN